MLFRKKEKENVQVIIDEKVVSLGDLKKKARKTNTRFWCLIVGTSMLSSMVLPYMSLASTYSSGSSDVFTGNIIIPGYSMGGVHVSAYGVDLNKWGQISKDAVVGSNFGIWSGERFKKASSNITNEVDGKKTELMESKQSANYNLDEAEKAIGWKAITGRAGYSAENPDGVSADEQSNMTDNVAPYRTTSDYNFWDARKPTSSDAGSASVDVTLYADFIIVGVAKDADGNEVVVPLESPDDVESSEEGVAGILFDQNRVSKENKVVSSAIPRYISLRDLFDKYAESDGKLNTPEGATLANLLDCVKDKDGNASILTSLAKDDSKDLLSSKTSTYKCINNPNLSEESTAFNPYPYSMVFSYNTGKGNIISSIYSNEEAYVYFSPSSAYSQYMALRKEYEAIKAESSTEIANHDPVVAIRLGYYLAEMAILEAYLDEALPQDMTRGYVGPSEPSTVVDVNSTDPNRTIAGDGKVKASAQIGSGASAEDFQKLSYATIMYDVVKAKLQDVSGDSYRLGETNSIMDTLSTFGYASSYVDANTKEEVKPAITTGVMKGMTGNDLLMRYNLFTPYHESQLQIRDAEAVYPEENKADKDRSNFDSLANGVTQHSNEEIQASDFAGATLIEEDSDYRVFEYWFPPDKAQHKAGLYVKLSVAKNGSGHGGKISLLDVNTGQPSGTTYTMNHGEATPLVNAGSEGDTAKVEELARALYSAKASEQQQQNQNAADARQNAKNLPYPNRSQELLEAAKAKGTERSSTRCYQEGKNSWRGSTATWYDLADEWDNGTHYYYGVSSPYGALVYTYYTNDGAVVWNYGGSRTEEMVAMALNGALSGLDVDVSSIAITSDYEEYATNYSDIAVPATAGTTESRKLDQDAALAGMYIPPYYPIQQHKLPDAEKPYRFQILSAVPYEVLIQYIKQNGFVNGVTLSYSSEEDASISKITNVEEGYNAIDATEAVLAARYGDSEKAGAAANLFLYDTNNERSTKMMALGSGTGYSVDDLKMQDPLNPTKDERKKVTAARIDSALVAFAANAMTADNVHDLFDVVRATKGLKYETWFRFYNPIKSEGGDGDLFVTRISPALTTYMPAILFNGYTAAGGAEIAPELATANCSFDYYSTPSFAPCFASHTASNCYYGVLTYEQRAFFSSEFIRTLSSTAGIPAVDAYEHLTEQIARLKEDSSSEKAVTWTNVATVYIMGKRLAYMEAAYDIASKSVSAPIQDLRRQGTVIDKDGNFNGWVDSALDNEWISNHRSEGGINGGKHITNIGGENGPWDRNVTLGFHSGDGAICEVKSIDKVTFGGLSDAVDGIVLDSRGLREDKAGKFTRHNHANPFDNGNYGSNGLDDWDSTSLYDSDGNRYEVSAALVMSYVYGKKLNALLGKGGKYYWTDMETIKQKLKDKDIAVAVDEEQGGSYSQDKQEYNFYTVRFNAGSGSWIANKSLGNGEVLSEYRKKISEACAEIALAMTNIGKDMKLLTQAMPNQMQNCLAWGDYQNSSDSENQFQQDPTQANVTVNVQEDPSKDLDLQTLQDKGITSKNDIEQYGFKVQETPNNDETFAQIGIDDEATDANGSLQAKMVRGVEGATWTSTTQPAEYTMTCTIGRVDSMAQESGTTYPYSGLANGRLQSGTDQYAMMQSHVIDYTSIASGIAGDLATRQRAKVVAITNPEYSSITDFLNILGNIGALFGELGKSMLKTMSEAFSSMFFKSSNAETQSIAPTGNNKDKAKAKADTILYRTPSGITMNRLPASATTFNSDTGQLEQSVISVDSGSPISNAAASERVSAFSGLLLNQGYALYSLLQTLGLTLVLVFVGFIAFSNFYAYAISNNEKMLQAQTQLKVVLPRTILAIFMIGLPPMAGSIGFEGGNYIVLSIINNVMTFIADIFFNLNGNGIMTIWDIDLVSTFGADIFAYLLFFLAALVMAACFLVGIVSLIIQTFVLFGFFLVGPIAWAFYVWPYSATMEAKDGGPYEASNKSKFSAITDKLNFGLFTGHRAGNLAPMGLLFNFTVIAGLTVAWALIFWLISMIFLGTTGSVMTSSNPTAAASAIHSTGYPQATAALLGDSNSDLFEIFGVGSSPQLPALRIIFATAICVAAFYIMVKLMLSTFHEAIGFSNTVAGRLANTAKDVLSDPTKLASVAGKAADILDKVPGPVGAAGKVAKGIDKATKAAGVLGDKQGGLAAKKSSKSGVGNLAKAAEGAAGKGLAGAKKETTKNKASKALVEKDKAGSKKQLKKGGKGRLADKLRQLSDVENAKKAVNKLNAGKAILDDLGKGNFLGAAGNALMANSKAKNAEEVAAMTAERDLNEKVRKAASALASGKALDDLDLDHQTRLALEKADVIGKDGSVSMDNARDLARSAENNVESLNKQIASAKALQDVKGQFAGNFGVATNKKAVNALTAAMGGTDTAEQAKKIAHEAEVQAILTEKGLSDTDSNRALAEGWLAAEESKVSKNLISYQVANAATNAKAKNKGVNDMLIAVENLGSDGEKLAFIAENYGEAPSHEEYYKMLSDLDQGKKMSNEQLLAMASYEAQRKITGELAPEAAFKAYSQDQMRESMIAQQQIEWANQSDVTIGHINDKYWTDGHVSKVPNTVFLQNDVGNVAEMTMSMRAAMQDAGIANSTINAMIDMATDNGGATSMVEVVGHMNNDMIGALNEEEMAAMDVMAQAAVGYGRRSSVASVVAKQERVSDYNDVVASTAVAGEKFEDLVRESMPLELVRYCESRGVFASADGKAFDAKTMHDNLMASIDVTDENVMEMMSSFGVDPNMAIEASMRAGNFYTGLVDDEELRGACHTMAASMFGLDLEKLETKSYYDWSQGMERMANITEDESFKRQLDTNEYKIAKVFQAVDKHNQAAGTGEQLDRSLVNEVVYAVQNSQSGTIEGAIREQAASRLLMTDDAVFSRWKPNSVDDYLLMGDMFKALAFDENSGYDVSRLTRENVSEFLSTHRVEGVDPNAVYNSAMSLRKQDVDSSTLESMFGTYDQYQNEMGVCEQISTPLETFLSNTDQERLKQQRREAASKARNQTTSRAGKKKRPGR